MLYVVVECWIHEPSPGDDDAADKGSVSATTSASSGKAAKGKAKAKAGGRPTKVDCGTKFCPDCSKTLPMTAFQPAQACCSDPCLKLRKSIRKSAVAENCLAWYDETKANPKEWKKLRAWALKSLGHRCDVNACDSPCVYKCVCMRVCL